MGCDTRDALEALDVRLKILLPKEYQDSYENVQPIPMRSAGLKYDSAGNVAWDQIWGSFCDLAMAGGPPHKGTLLEPGTDRDIDAQFDRYNEVAEEICRGVSMVTALRAYVSPTPGWIRVTCLGDAMAGWLTRAIVMENVAARRQGSILELPAAPHFRLEKEIKNVVTVAAKTCHYWIGHIPREQQQAIADLFMTLAAESPCVEPDFSMERTAGWRPVECGNVHTSVWMMRALVAHNVLSRREGTVLLVPVNRATDPDGTLVSNALARVQQLAAARGIL
jgi:sirohydrochlorin cobaltochelatase